ncbi:MAG: class I SAM-dependent methyltransferase [Anaerolineales bacterium]|nr:class I SAM-dependent methyltransferase [Anaerolineales bacterium]
MSGKTNYGNWMPHSVLFWSLTASMLLLLTGLLLGHPAWKWILYPLSALCAAFFLYLASASCLLGKDHGRLQREFTRLVLDRLPWDGGGKALDIGTGNGALAIELAKRFPASEVTGTDLWGKPWDYSRDSCVANGVLESVGNRVRFIPAGAEGIPFANGYFDAVVSNFVFHAVNVPDRRVLLMEALRILKKGGAFSFQDLFNSEFYQAPENLEKELKSWGLQEVHFVKSSDYVKIPPLLRINHIAGNSGVLFGTK